MFKTQVSYRQGCIREAGWSARVCTAKVKVGFHPLIPTTTTLAPDDGSFFRFFHIFCGLWAMQFVYYLSFMWWTHGVIGL